MQLNSNFQLLIDRGANIDERDTRFGKDGPLVGPTALMMAAILGRTKLLRYLINAGADVNLQDWRYGAGQGQTALHAALRAFPLKIESIELLINNGADVSIKDGNKENPYEYFDKKHKSALKRHAGLQERRENEVVLEVLKRGRGYKEGGEAENSENDMDSAEHERRWPSHLS